MKAGHYLGTVIGAAIAGILVFSVWGKLAGAYGLMGGWLAAMVTITIAWGVNHFVGAIKNVENGAWIDMALGIGVAGTTMGMFQGLSFANAFPTWICVAIGGVLGGICAGIVQQSLNQ